MQKYIRKMKQLSKSRLFWPLLALIAVIIFDIAFIDGFLSIEVKNGNLYGRIIDIINRSASLMLLAAGMTLVIATKGIDISVGSTVAISGAIVVSLLGPLEEAKTPIFICIMIALLVSAVLGAWNGFLVSKIGVQPVVATLILMVAGRGIAQLITNGQIPTTFNKSFSYIAGFLPGLPIPFSIIIAAAVIAVILAVVKKTAFGMFIEAVGVNPSASRFAGIKVKKVIFLAYVISGVCAGIAGLMIASMIKAADSNNAGLGIEMDAILAVALGGNSLNGGRFSIMASIIGALVIQCLTTTMYAIGVSPQVLPVVKAIVVVIICLIQSEAFRVTVTNLFYKGRREAHEKNAVKL